MKGDDSARHSGHQIHLPAAGLGSEKRDGGEKRDGDRSLLTLKDAATSIKMQGDLLGRDALPVA